MNSIEFGKMCQPYNKEYFKKFGEVPSIDDYAVTQEEFFEALKNALIENHTIDHYIPVRAKHNDGRLE